MTQDEYRLQWLKWHDGYERRAKSIFRKALKLSISRMPYDNLNYENYKFIVPLNVNRDVIEQAYIQAYNEIGLLHGNRTGRSINRDIKNFFGPLFNEEFQNSIIEWVRQNCGLRITSVARTLADSIINLIGDAFDNNLTIEQMQKFVRDRIGRNVLSRYEILRIARTESTAAANHGATVSGQTSGIVLEKVWIATVDSRTRRKPKDEWSHIAMNGISVEENGLFEMRSKKGEVNRIEYPCAPGSSAGNAINCRCTIALRPKRDADGLVILK